MTTARDSAGRTRNDLACLLVLLPSVAVFAVAIAFFWKFTAEDAFIVYRYGENLVDFGRLQYNLGERVQAFTSPLHVLIQAVLYKSTGSSLTSGKALAIFEWVITVFLLLRCTRDSFGAVAIGACLLLSSPCAVLWVAGGLETPLLALLVTALIALVYDAGPAPWRVSRLSAIFALAGLAFLTRFDSVVFAIPVAAFAASRAGSIRRFAASCLPAVLLPLAWLVFAWLYYGDVLPTSFYTKTPDVNYRAWLNNYRYIVQWLVLSAVVPLLTLPFILRSLRPPIIRVSRAHFEAAWWLYAGVCLQLCYGLTIATTHMMFGFRFFVPYLPAAALILADLYRKGGDAAEERQRAGWNRSVLAVAAATVLVQSVQILWVYNHSLQGFERGVGEYRAIGAASYAGDFLSMLRKEAHEIRRDWASRRTSADRPPRLATFAAGVLPYTYKEAYIYEQLLSYRHRDSFDVRRSADYIHVLTPRHGTIEEQIVKPLREYELVSSHTIPFDGDQETFMVYYDPHPDHHTLPARIIDPSR